MTSSIRLAPFILLILSLWATTTTGAYQIGVGRADCTGPSAGVVFMGYAKSQQIGCGIHLRQFSRAFIFDDGVKRVLYVTSDACMMPHGVKRAVLASLEEVYNKTYTYDNVILSGTHTHGTPGGFMMDLMYDIPDLGFVPDTFNALVKGIVEAIKAAHNNMVEGTIRLSVGRLLDANINRSPASYLQNPAEERQKYLNNTDQEMVQLKFVRTSDNTPIGAINWYAVHPTSMNNTNCLVTSDNVGYASILFEHSVNGQDIPGQGPFVGAFASTNLGDVSPNIKGPICINTGKECDFVRSTCDGDAKYCIASGPGDNMVESTKIIAHRLLNKAQELFSGDNYTEVTGSINYIHQFVEMPKQNATIKVNGKDTLVSGCTPAMGYAFAGGTTDGPGEFDFAQGTLTSNPFWDAVRNFAFPPTPEDVTCHAPKPILITSGRIHFPYEWIPTIVATQMLQLGNVILTAVPGEFTTMSGRRLRQAITDTVKSSGGSIANNGVIITGLSNVYTSYIATPEEYSLQRYEGGSTIYGPHTLDIYLKLYRNLAATLLQNGNVDQGPLPKDFSDDLITFTPPVLYDTAEIGRSFGDCVKQPSTQARINDTVSAVFVSGHPRNNFMQIKTFLTVEKQTNDNQWTIVATDANWETRFIWKIKSLLKGTSRVTIEWDIGANVTPGTYRIRHYGHYKILLAGVILPYEGVTNSFSVI